MTDHPVPPPDGPNYVEPVGAAAAELHHVSPHDLTVDERYQRQLNAAMVAAMVKKFDPALFGTLEVNFREDGTLYVIDGQHRTFVARQIGLPSVPVRMHFGLTPEQEAVLFIRFQQGRRAVTPLEAFHAGVFAGNPESIAIVELLHDLGWKLPKKTGQGGSRDSLSRSITAVTTVVRIYRYDNGGLLTRVLNIYGAAWGSTGGRVNGQVLQGLAYLLSRKNDLDDASMVRKLQVKEPADIMRAARSTAMSSGNSTVISAVAAQILVLYNKGRREAHKVDGSDLFTRAAPGDGVTVGHAVDLSGDTRGMASYTPEIIKGDGFSDGVNGGKDTATRNAIEAAEGTEFPAKLRAVE